MTLLELEAMGFKVGWLGKRMDILLTTDKLGNKLKLVYKIKSKIPRKEKNLGTLIKFENSFFLVTGELHEYPLNIKNKEDLEKTILLLKHLK